MTTVTPQLSREDRKLQMIELMFKKQEERLKRKLEKQQQKNSTAEQVFFCFFTY